MSIWKLVDASANEYDVANLPIKSLTINYNNMATDVATLIFDRAWNAAMEAWLADGSAVKIKRDGVVVFAGVVDHGARARIMDQQISIVINGPWDVLEKTVFTQTYTDAVTATTRTSSQYTFAATLSVRDRIAAAFTCAAAGGELSSATPAVSSSLYAPEESGNNKTCAQIVIDGMKYFPGSFVSVDYTQTPPKFYPLAIDASGVADLSLSTGELIYEKDNAQRVTRVCLHYERPYEVYNEDGTLYSSGRMRVATDEYPSTGGYGKGVIIRNTQLGGTYQKRRISYRCRTYGNSSAAILNPFLAANGNDPRLYTDVGLLLSANGFNCPSMPYSSVYGGQTWLFNTPVLSTSHPYCVGCGCYNVVALNHQLWTDALPNALYCWWIPDSSNTSDAYPPPEELYENTTIWFGTATVQSMWVNAVGSSDYVTHEFTINLAIRAGGTCPDNVTISADVTDISGTLETAPAAGAAQALYTSLNANYYKGSFTAREAACRAIDKYTRRVTISSAASAVQTINQDIMSGSTTYTFGRPTHLSPQDFLAILRK